MLHIHTQRATDHSQSFYSASSAVSALKAGTKFAAQYNFVKGDGSVNVGVSNSFKEGYNYALHSFQYENINAFFTSTVDVLQTKLLSLYMDRCPTWDPNDADTINAFNTFFDVTGTHVITGVNYGGRFSFVSSCPKDQTGSSRHLANPPPCRRKDGCVMMSVSTAKI